MILFSRFKEVASRSPDKPAIIHETTTITYQELLVAAQQLSNALQASMDEGAVLGLYMTNPIDFVCSYLAAANTRCKLVLIDNRLALPDIEVLLKACDITHVLSTPEESITLSSILADGGQLETSHYTLRDKKAVICAVADDKQSGEYHYHTDDFVVHGTSGTTGVPKGIVLSQNNMQHRIDDWSKSLSLTSTDVVLCTLTLSHCHGIDVLMLPGIFCGGTVIAPDLQKLSPRRIAKLISEHGVSIFSTLPYMYELMVEAVSADRLSLDTVRFLMSGSAPLSDSTADNFANKFGRPINQIYGLSEIGVICMNYHPQNTGYVGSLIEGIEGKIVDDAGNPVSTGELVVRGPALARGYLKSPDSEREMFRDGWLWTRDIVSQDSVGIKIQSRISRFINSGGNKINPTEVEDALMTHPQVVEAVVISEPDKILTERIIAAVTMRNPDVLVTELHQYMSTQVATYKLPAEYVYVDSIPRNAIGKVKIAEVEQCVKDRRTTTDNRRVSAAEH